MADQIVHLWETAKNKKHAWGLSNLQEKTVRFETVDPQDFDWYKTLYILDLHGKIANGGLLVMNPMLESVNNHQLNKHNIMSTPD